MQPLLRLSDAITRAVTVIAGLMVLIMMVHVSAEVIVRGLTGQPLFGTVEIVSRYYMVTIAFLPLIWAERRGSMVSVEMIDGLLGPTSRRISDFSVAALSTAVYLVLAWASWRIAASNFETRSFVTVVTRQLPICPTYFLPPLGFVLAAFATATRMIGILTGRRVTE